MAQPAGKCHHFVHIGSKRVAAVRVNRGSCFPLRPVQCNIKGRAEVFGQCIDIGLMTDQKLDEVQLSVMSCRMNHLPAALIERAIDAVFPQERLQRINVAPGEDSLEFMK